MIVTILLIIVAVLVLLGLVLASASVRVLREYERGVVFRLGRLVEERGPEWSCCSRTSNGSSV